jgi:hypothetical protein
MHDPNNYRYHYRRTSEHLAREKRLQQTLHGVCVTSGILAALIIYALCC